MCGCVGVYVYVGVGYRGNLLEECCCRKKKFSQNFCTNFYPEFLEKGQSFILFFFKINFFYSEF